MSLAFGGPKRRLLGWLALLAPLPLPFNELLPWPGLVVYLAVVAGFLRRARRDRTAWLPTWAANLLGAAYLPVFGLDLMFFAGGRVVGPLVRLGLFALSVKLFRLRGENDKWQVFAGGFIVFLAAMGTSVHPSIVLYLVAYLAVALLVLVRFAHFGVLADLGHRERDPSPVRLRVGGVVAGLTVASALVAIPLFAILPRARAPFIAGRGSPASANVVSVANFSDEVTLDSIGRQRGNRGVALRLAYDPPLDERFDEPRIKAGAYDRFDGRTWHRPEPASNPPFTRTFDGRFQLAPGGRPAARRATVWRQVIDSSSVPLPVETLRFRLGVSPGLQFDAGGVARLAGRPHDVLSYEVELGTEAFSAALPPAPQSGLSAAADVDLEVAALARRVVAGAATDAEKLARLERHLAENYTYSLDFLGAPGERPVEDFLLRTRRGHCEYFATALVLLLRAEGVPARLVSGFLGGEVNPIDGHLVVRQDNAHAWVEAWIDSRGWVTSDPTPPVGRPAFGSPGAARLASQVWDFVVFRWDRYVLTYGAADQREFLIRAFDGVWRWWQRVRRGERAVEPVAPAHPAEQSAPVTPPGSTDRRPTAPAVLTAASLLAAIAWFVWAMRERRGGAERAYRRLRLAVAEALRPARRPLGPLALLDQIRDLAPSISSASQTIVEAYLQESFAGFAPGASFDAELKTARRELARLARGTRRER